MMTKTLVVLMVVVTLVLHSKLTNACVCDSLRDKHFHKQFCDADFVFKATVIRRTDRPTNPVPAPPGPGGFKPAFPKDVYNTGLYVKYDIKELIMFGNKRNLPEPSNVWSYAGGQCQATFQPGQEYLMLGDLVNEKYVAVTMCEYNVLWDHLSAFQKTSLENSAYSKACSDCKAEFCFDCTDPWCCADTSTNPEGYCEVKKPMDEYNEDMELELKCLSRHSYCGKSNGGKCAFIKDGYKKCMKAASKSKKNNKQSRH